MTDLAVDVLALARGDQLPDIAVRVEADDVRAYLLATGEAAAPPGASTREWNAVPPLAVGAFVLSALMERMPLAAGTLHAGQEFEFLRAVRPGEQLTARVTVARRAGLLTVLAIDVRAADGPVATGRTTIVSPAGPVDPVRTVEGGEA